MGLSNNPVALGGGGAFPSGASTLVGSAGSSTDNAIARWDGTTGSLIQNSVLIVADTTGALSGFGTGTGITLHGGGTITGADGAITLTASGTNQNITSVASGTGWLAVNGNGSNNAIIRVVGSNFGYVLVGDSSAAADNKYYQIISDGGVFSIKRTNDAVDAIVGTPLSFTSDNATFGGNVVVPAAKTLSVGGAAAAVTTATKLIKAVAAIADNTATTVLTITVPNAAHSASVAVTLVGSLGAGGAIGANEASQSITYDIGIARTAGVAMNAVISTAYGSSGSVAVAGAATVAVTAAITLNAEGVSVTNTASVKVTIARGSGSSDNHTCLVKAEVLNANATGITIT